MGPGAASTPAHRTPQPHVVGPEVRVVLLDAVVQDRDHNALPRQPLAPGLQDVQVRLHLVVLCEAGTLGSGALWPHPTQPPSPAASPCTTAWGTRGLWVPPPSASPAAAASAARTTAPGGGCTLQGLPDPRSQPPSTHAPSGALPLPVCPTDPRPEGLGLLLRRTGLAPRSSKGRSLVGPQLGGMCPNCPPPVLGPSWCWTGPGTLCLLRLFSRVPTCLGLCLQRGPRSSDHQSPGLTDMWLLLFKSKPAPFLVPVLDPSAQDLPISPQPHSGHFYYSFPSLARHPWMSIPASSLLPSLLSSLSTTL